VNAHGLQGLDLFGHSHGASVTMLATHGGLGAGKLILLSCPVHPTKYFPDFAHVQRVISIRVRLDLVILADGGGQRFRDMRIEENVLPIWFDHSATHDPAVWNQYNLALRI
jgi:alpha-beta hydrolase superfamily lysophospholipase